MPNKIPLYAPVLDENGFVSRVWLNYLQSVGADISGVVESVTGTPDRITVTGTAINPIVDIAATYTGQASITTVGTLTELTVAGASVFQSLAGVGPRLATIEADGTLSTSTPGSGIIYGGGTINNVTMFTGTEAVGDAPGFLWHTGDGGYYTLAYGLTITGTITANTGAFGSLTSTTANIAAITTASITDSGLSGTGTRLVTSTVAGLLGNATTIAGNYILSGSLGIGVGSTYDLDLTKSTSGSGVVGNISNSSNTAGSYATQYLQVGGDLAGDPATIYNIAGFTAWIAGVQNNDSDSYKISASGALGTSNFLRISTSGFFTITGAMSISTTLAVTGLITNSALTASLPVVTDASKRLTSATVTGTGTTIVMSSGPTISTSITASYATASTAAAFDGSKNLVSVANTGSGDNVLSASPTLTGILTAAAANFSGRINVNGAVDTSGFHVNVYQGNISASRVGGTGGRIRSYGLGVPGDTNTEYMEMYHDSATDQATIDTTQSGSGTRRSLVLRTGGTARLTIDATTGAAIFSAASVFSAGIASAASLAGGFYEADSFTGTLTGCTTSPASTVRWVRVGNMVTLHIATISGTSNSGACTITGMPASIRPARIINSMSGLVQNSGASEFGSFDIDTGGVITLSRMAVVAAPGAVVYVAFDTSGTKGCQNVSLSYIIS